MMKTFTCIVCPNGCDIIVVLKDKEIMNFKGALCKKGVEYVEQELTNPKRNISTSVKIKNGEFELVSVKLSGDISKEKIFAVMKEIKSIEAEAPIKIGDIVRKNILNLQVDVIATKNVENVY